MICDQLARTGPTLPLTLLAVVGVVCVVAGVMLAVRGSRRRTAVSTSLLVLLVLTATTIAPFLSGPAAQASTSGCSMTGASVQVSQTSALEGLAPGIEPAPITGLVTNTGTDTVLIGTVEVSIASVTTAPSADGPCDASDYVLLHGHMPVDQALGPNRSISFAGASIGFENKTTAQDACKGATVHLLYTLSSPEYPEGAR